MTTPGFARRLFNRVGPLVAPRWYQRRATLLGAKHWDMSENADEQFYAREYLAHVLPALAAAGAKRVLDLGCGQGRIAIPLARAGYRVTGVDWSPDVLEAGRRYASGADGLTFEQDEVVGWLRRAADASYDAILALEILYMMGEWRQAIREILRVVTPGGVCALGFRPKLYYLRYHARRGEFDLVRRVAESGEGRLGTLRFNWHTRDEVVTLLRDAGFREVTCLGIGVLSGIPGDPLDHVAQPSRLPPAGQAALLETELRLAETFAEEGRYLLAMAWR